MDWSLLTMFLNANKVGGYARAGVAGLIGLAISKWPFLSQYLDPTTQDALGVAASGIAVGLWSHLAKAIADQATPRTPIGMKAGAAIGSALLFGFLLFSGDAHAQMVTKAPPPAATPTGCYQLSCTGFDAGGAVYGVGGNAAILQNGLQQSIFAGGGSIGLNAGWQYWDSRYYFGLDVDGLIESQNTAGVTGFAPNGSSSAVGIVHVKLGGNLVQLFASASASPLAVPSFLSTSLMATYIDNCSAFRKGGTQYCGGMGQQFWLAKNFTLDLLYDYGAPTKNFNALQYVGTKVSYHF